MARELCLLGPQLEYLVELSLAANSVSKNVTLRVSDRPLADLLKPDFGRPFAVIVCLGARENVADIREVMNRYPETTFLFLTQDSPPRSAVAHAVHEGGGEVIAKPEAAVVIAATLINQLAAACSSA
jgi:hypothetical protein